MNTAMRIEMNYDDMWLPRWRWETEDKIAVCSMDDHAASFAPDVASHLSEVLREFSLPLRIEMGNQRLNALVRRLADEASDGNEIVCLRFLDAIDNQRQRESDLHPALAIAFDGSTRKLRAPPGSNPNERAEWGWTDVSGLVLLRLCPGVLLRNVVRHEVGHLLGIGKHHPRCVMSWACSGEKFCESCINKIRDICRIC
jgi:hypothetical protein